MKRLLKNRKADIYVYIVLIVGLFTIPVFWYIFHTIFWSVQPVAVAVAVSMGTNTTEFYQVDTLFQGFDNWIHVIGLLALGLFGFVYSQRRGRRY